MLPTATLSFNPAIILKFPESYDDRIAGAVTKISLPPRRKVGGGDGILLGIIDVEPPWKRISFVTVTPILRSVYSWIQD